MLAARAVLGMSVLAGLFLIAHGLLHLAVWVAPAPPDATFDARRSWLIGDAPALTRGLAVAACVLFAVAGVLVLVGAGAAATVAVIGAAVSLGLVGLTFHPWFSFAVAINVAIIVVALG